MRSVPSVVQAVSKSMSTQQPLSFEREPDPRSDQESRILAYLQQGYRLTALDALNRFQCMRLGARCWNLQRKGHPIISERKKLANGKVVAEYRYEAK